MLVQLSYLPDPLQRLFVSNMATEGIGRVRRISDNAPCLDNFSCLVDQPELRIFRMYAEELAHFRSSGKNAHILANKLPEHLI